MAVQIQIRRGLAAEWTLTNPILAQGELAIELDTNKLKIGNGINDWNSLAYVSNINSINDIPGVIADSPAEGSLLVYSTSTDTWVASTSLNWVTIDGGTY